MTATPVPAVVPGALVPRVLVLVPGLERIDAEVHYASERTSDTFRTLWNHLIANVYFTSVHSFSYSPDWRTHKDGWYYGRDTQQSLATSAHLLEEQLNALQPEAQLELVGYSLGGAVIAQWLGTGDPALVARAHSFSALASPLAGISYGSNFDRSFLMSMTCFCPAIDDLETAAYRNAVRTGVQAANTVNLWNASDLVVSPSMSELKGVQVYYQGSVGSTCRGLLGGDPWCHQGIFALSDTNQKVLWAIQSDGPRWRSYGPTLAWPLQAGASGYRVQVTPFGNDGPGVDLLLAGDQWNFQIPPPPQWYGLLPDMTYTYAVRPLYHIAAENPPIASGSFRTPVVALGAVTYYSLTAPAPTCMPALTWTAPPEIFYFEVRVSKDRWFGAQGPTAMVYHELVHGGLTGNSYTIPARYPLEAGATYHWQVRPRIQGDGAPISWGGTAFASCAAR